MSLSAAGVLAGTPAASGTFTFTATVTDTNSCTGTAPRTLSILSGPNQAPSFTAGPNQTSLEDAGPQAVAWATGISPGPSPDETGQVVTFNVTNDTTSALQPRTGGLAGGRLDLHGGAERERDRHDHRRAAGQRRHGRRRRRHVRPQTFTITITAVNDAPSFVKGTDPIAVVEDSGPTTLIGWATGISAGPTDEAGQVLTFNLTGNTNPALFAVLPAIDPSTGTLTFTLQPNASGTTTLTWTLSDNGGTANGGANTSAPQTVVINVGAVNDPPAAVNDAATTDEDTVLTVPPPGVLANDIDPDAGDTRTVIAVNGLAANVGTPITLASGALLTAERRRLVCVRPDGGRGLPGPGHRPVRHRDVHLHHAGRGGGAVHGDGDDHDHRRQRRAGDRPRRRRQQHRDGRELPVHVHRRRSAAVRRGCDRRHDHRRRQHRPSPR